MLLERIYDWARSQPKKTAIIYNDVPINYASFPRTIDAARRFLEPHALSAGRTAIVLFNSPLDGWILLLALRSAPIGDPLPADERSSRMCAMALCDAGAQCRANHRRAGRAACGWLLAVVALGYWSGESEAVL